MCFRPILGLSDSSTGLRLIMIETVDAGSIRAEQKRRLLVPKAINAHELLVHHLIQQLGVRSTLRLLTLSLPLRRRSLALAETCKYSKPSRPEQDEEATRLHG